MMRCRLGLLRRRFRAHRLRRARPRAAGARQSAHHRRQDRPADDRHGRRRPPRYVWPVSTGRAGYNTPKAASTGRSAWSATISACEWDDAPMPYSIFFTQKGHAFHGTNHKIDQARPELHGCVRLSVAAHAAILWGLVKQHKMATTPASS